MRRVLIGVCTFRRPSLRRTLLSLAAQDVLPGIETRLAVADNDDMPSARTLVATIAEEAGRPIAYRHCPARNISVARNGILDLAEAEDTDLLAFLDDDEWVEPHWLASLIAALDAAGADAAFGPVRAVYGDAAPAWMQAGGFHDMRPEVDGQGFVRTGHTANVLLRLDTPALRGRRFDPGFGRSGGEDTAFFAGAKQAGAVLALAPDALAFEHVPPERTRVGWLVRRRFRMGQTHGTLIGSGATPARRAGLLALAGAKTLACLAMAVPALPFAERRSRALLRGCLHAGAVASLSGLPALRLYGTADHGRPGPQTPPSDRSPT